MEWNPLIFLFCLPISYYFFGNHNVHICCWKIKINEWRMIVPINLLDQLDVNSISRDCGSHINVTIAKTGRKANYCNGLTITPTMIRVRLPISLSKLQTRDPHLVGVSNIHICSNNKVKILTSSYFVRKWWIQILCPGEIFWS